MIAKDWCLSIGNIRSLIYINKLFRDTSAHQQYKTICETQTVQSKMRHTNSGVHDAQLLHYVTQHDSKAKHHGTLCKLGSPTQQTNHSAGCRWQETRAHKRQKAALPIAYLTGLYPGELISGSPSFTSPCRDTHCTSLMGIHLNYATKSKCF